MITKVYETVLFHPAVSNRSRADIFKIMYIGYE